MCLLLRKSELFRLVLGIITMFILCLPEFFKIHEANTVIVSCMDTCSSNNTTFPLCTFNNSCKRSVQQRRENQTILLKAIVNHSNFQNIPCVCQTSRREQQSHTKHTGCESKRDVNVAHRGSGSVVKKTKGSLEVKTEDGIYFYKYFNLTMVSEKEEVEHNTYYMLEIHINNSIVGGRNAAGEYLNHSCLVAMMEDQNDCINISLQLKSYMEYPMCMTKIIWLTMIPVVFVFTISIVIYKIVQENEQNYCKHRVATSISTILRRKGSRHARRSISATKIHPFPVKTSKQESPLTAQSTKILFIIPEQEHCHVGASTVEGRSWLRSATRERLSTEKHQDDSIHRIDKDTYRLHQLDKTWFFPQEGGRAEVRSVYQVLLDQRASSLYHSTSCSPESRAFRTTDNKSLKEEAFQPELHWG